MYATLQGAYKACLRLLVLLFSDFEAEKMSRAYRNYIMSIHEEKLARKRQRDIIREECHPFDLPKAEFLENFKISSEMVKYLCQELDEDLAPRTTSGMATVFKVLSSLKILMTGHYQRSTANEQFLSIGQTTVSKYLNQFLDSVNSRLQPLWVLFPGTVAAREQIAAGFGRKCGLPNILGCIDCTHVKLFPPKKPTHVQYINRHGNTSLNIQLIVDSECRILNVNANYPGRVHDQFIFNNSSIREELRRLYETRVGDYFLLGDSGYALEPWLMTPIRDAERNSSAQKYTNWHCQTRNVVERVNGYLKGTFRCLGVDRSLHYTPDKTSRIVYACCTLYNIMKHYRVPMEQTDTAHESRNLELFEPNGRLFSVAMNKRERIIHQYFSS